VGNPTETALARLQADWPHWEFWIIRKAIGGPDWCADSPEHLAEYLEDTVSEPLDGDR
jgi:hypothetical protein